MAMFHFRLKSDKKPDGTKISAVQHVKYINREENSSSQAQWEEKNKFVGNVITTAEVKDVLDGQNTLLYKTDDFGSIRNSANGIEVTENASETTIAITLLLSHEAILRKNYKFVRQLEEMESRVKNLTQRMNHAKEQLDALKICLDRDKPNTCYKVISSDNDSVNSLAALIADAILREPQAAQLVARFTGNNLEMERDWELMSELDKDEFIRKKIIREL